MSTTYPAIWAICPMRFLLAFAQGGVISPLLPLLRETFHISHGELGLLTSMAGVSSVAMDILATSLMQRFAVLTLVLYGISLTGVGLVCSVAAPGFYWLVGAQMLLGFGLSMTRVASLTVLVAATPRSAQGRAHNLLEFAAIAGIMISPTLSGLMATFVHWRAAFGLATLFVAGAFAWVCYTRRALAKAMETAPNVSHVSADSPPTASASPVAPSPRQPHRLAIGIAYLATFMLSFTWSGFLSTALPLFGGEVLSIPPATLGLVFTVGLLADLVLLLPIGWLSDRLECRVVLTPAILLMAAALLYFPQAHNVATLVLVSVALHTGFAAWGMPSAALALLTQGVPLARTMGIYRLLVDGAVVVAPWLIGTCIGRYGYTVPTWGTAGVLIGTALLVAQYVRQARDQTRS